MNWLKGNILPFNLKDYMLKNLQYEKWEEKPSQTLENWNATNSKGKSAS